MKVGEGHRVARLAALPPSADAGRSSIGDQARSGSILRELIADAEARLLAAEHRDAQAKENAD
jgi:hypothetical protein